MGTQGVTEEWANSLVGRDWEIFWKDTSDDAQPVDVLQANDGTHTGGSGDGMAIAGTGQAVLSPGAPAMAMAGGVSANPSVGSSEQISDTTNPVDMAIMEEFLGDPMAMEPTAVGTGLHQQGAMKASVTTNSNADPHGPASSDAPVDAALTEQRRSKRGIKKSAKLRDAEESRATTASDVTTAAGNTATSAYNLGAAPQQHATGDGKGRNGENGHANEDQSHGAGEGEPIGVVVGVRVVPDVGFGDALVGAQTGAETTAASQAASKDGKDDDDDYDDDSEGSVIADWYAGRVLSVRKTAEGNFMFKVSFVGEDDVYEMENLDSSNVRPSAIGWVKRSKALLENPCTTDKWFESIPADTSMVMDMPKLNELNQSLMSVNLLPFEITSHQESPSISPSDLPHIRRIQHLRYLLLSQVYLRTRIAKIVNHHGSSKFVDGEPNPTETYVDHLVSCMKGLERTCAWYCTCWQLLQYVHALPSASQLDAPTDSNQSQQQQPQPQKLSVERVASEYLETGRNTVLYCLELDPTPTAAGKRKGPNPLLNASHTRRTKRRKKNRRTDPHADNEDIIEAMPTTINEMIDVLKTTSEDRWCVGWCLGQFGRMIDALSASVLRPALDWHHEASNCLGNITDDTLRKELHEKVGPQIRGETNGEHGSGEDGVDRAENRNEDDEDSDVSESETSHQRKMTYEEIHSCYSQASNDPVLRHFEFTDLQSRLSEMLDSILAFQTKAEAEIDAVLSETSLSSKQDDQCLRKLQQLLDESANPNSHCFRVEPFGQQPCVLTKAILANARDLRIWLIDLRHAESMRERPDFVNGLLRRAEGFKEFIASLQSESNVAQGLWQNCLNRLQALLQKYGTIYTICQMYHSQLTGLAQNNGTNTMGNAHLPASPLLSQNGINTALAELATVPYLSVVEELVAVRSDLLNWLQQLQTLAGMDGSGAQVHPSFSALKQLHELLILLQTGRSARRSMLTKHVEPNEAIDQQVQLFAARSLQEICPAQCTVVITMYQNASAWKTKADAVIHALAAHGNRTVAGTQGAHKVTGMVDIKRIYDLIEMYNLLGVDIAECISSLQKVYDEALRWKAGLEGQVANFRGSFSQCLQFVISQRDLRPQGIIMEPTRSTYDGIVDVVNWYQRIKAYLASIPQYHTTAHAVVSEQNLASDAKTLAPIQNGDSPLLQEVGYTLLLEGVDIVLQFLQSSTVSEGRNPMDHPVVPSDAALLSLRMKRRPSRSLPLDKLKTSDLGLAIISRMLQIAVDASEGGPLRAMCWVLWHVKISRFVEHCSNPPQRNVAGTQLPVVFSLDDAIQLQQQQPQPQHIMNTHAQHLQTNFESQSQIQQGFLNLTGHHTAELQQFYRVFAEAQTMERDISQLLSSCKELVRNTLQNQELIRTCSAKLKDFFVAMKLRSKGGNGLSLNRNLEPQLDLQIKTFNWLVRTFPYPMLYLDEATYAVSHLSGTTTNRIPWDVLVSLFERLPAHIEDTVGDVALVILRIKELHQAAKAWQDEITKNTMLSFRGGRRRVPSGSPTKSRDAEPDLDASSSQVNLLKVERLASDPILTKVIMPREDAVCGIHQTSNKFEQCMQDLLGKDFHDPDRTPYPETESLVGERGEFILYKLTGSPIFVALRTLVHSLSILSGNLLAETPGKAAFDWIRKASTWIEQLNAAVTPLSPFEKSPGRGKLVIPNVDAYRLLEAGKEIFLQVPDDLRRAISAHGIFISTNKQDATLRVMFKKDGAHHSIGGTTLRWCPLLFDCLRNDIATLAKWENSMKDLLNDFRQFHTEYAAELQSERALLKWLAFRSGLSRLLDEGREGLVVSPAKNFVDSFVNLLVSMESYLAKFSTKELNDKFEKSQYESSASILSNRYELLDALLLRRQLSTKTKARRTDTTSSTHGNSSSNNLGSSTPNAGADAVIHAPEKTSFRDTCRNALSKAFRSASKAIGVDLESSDATTKQDLNAFCAMRAWEIERALFERYQKEDGIARVSNDYRDKARSLRYNFEDKNNRTLCPRVLVGEIPVARLIVMTPEELASQKRKSDRAKAEEKAQSQLILNKPTTPGKKGNATASRSSMRSVGAGRNGAASSSSSPLSKASNTKLRAKNGKPTTKLTLGKLTALSAGGSKDLRSTSKQKQHTASRASSISRITATMTAAPEPESTGLSALAGGLSEADIRAALAVLDDGQAKPAYTPLTPPPYTPPPYAPPPYTPPPPPPPLRMGTPTDLVASSTAPRSQPNGAGQRIKSAEGNDRYRFEVNGILFFGCLVAEDALNMSAEGYLPESMKDKGRLRIDEFTRFLSDKVRSGRWKTISFRLTLQSDVDSQSYNRFRKEYENKQRIAMFAINQNTKVFLLTPMFHTALPRSGSTRCSTLDPASTYVIMLTKERV